MGDENGEGNGDNSDSAEVRRLKETPEGRRLLTLYKVRWEALQGSTTNPVIAARLSKLAGYNIDPARVSTFKNARALPNSAIFLAMVEASDQSIDEVLFEGRFDASHRELQEQIRGLEQRRLELEREVRRWERRAQLAQEWGVTLRGRGEVRIGPPGLADEQTPEDH